MYFDSWNIIRLQMTIWKIADNFVIYFYTVIFHVNHSLDYGGVKHAQQICKLTLNLLRDIDIKDIGTIFSMKCISR